MARMDFQKAPGLLITLWLNDRPDDIWIANCAGGISLRSHSAEKHAHLAGVRVLRRHHDSSQSNAMM
jgi:hypothetical protein